MLCNPIYWHHREMNSKLETQADLRKMRSYKKFGLEFKQLIYLIKCCDTSWRFRVVLYKTLFSNIALCSKQTWTISQKPFSIVDFFERKILGKIFGPTPVSGVWHRGDPHLVCCCATVDIFTAEDYSGLDT
jgi:hypothetical protein